MRVFNNSTLFAVASTVDLTFDLTKDSSNAAHSAGSCDGTLYTATGTACTLSSPLCIIPGTDYSWCDTDLASQGPMQGAASPNSGDLLITFAANIVSLHLETLGLDTVLIQALDSSGDDTESVFRYTLSQKFDTFMGLIPASACRAIRLIAKRNVEWKINVLSAEAE